jgi:hypothetical protein
LWVTGYEVAGCGVAGCGVAGLRVVGLEFRVYGLGFRVLV